jgi:HTH-type transcriptional regulator/antitoxin HipB
VKPTFKLTHQESVAAKARKTLYQAQWRNRNRLRDRELRWRSKGLPAPSRPCPQTCEACGSPPLGKDKTLCLDHCHDTGAFRGWLCSRCNKGVGMCGDTLDGLLLRVAYLERAKVVGASTSLLVAAPKLRGRQKPNSRPSATSALRTSDVLPSTHRSPVRAVVTTAGAREESRAVVARTAQQLGQALRTRRAKLKLSQAAVGTKVGIKQDTVSALEIRTISTTIETLFKALSGLGLELVLQEKAGPSVQEW